MPTAHVNGAEIFYSLEGPQTRPVVTLSHSLMANHRMWDAQMPALRDYCVLRYDTRGPRRLGRPRKAPIRWTCWPMTPNRAAGSGWASGRRCSAGCRWAA